MYLADTIVAPATPPGSGAVAIVRLSGPRAIEIALALWRPPRGRPGPPSARELRLGEIRDPVSGAPIDRALLAIFPAPRSLTGEDVAELQCHGGRYLVRRVVALAAAAGARPAEAGEFTRRAYLNGRIDLTEAEAIADLVAARGDAALGQALAQLSGALADRVTGLRRQVLALRARLEAEIDFSEEDLNLPPREDFARAADALAADLGALLDTFRRGRIVRDGARAAIIGKPNAGKSSLLNLLLGADRAIVTPIPGTTRDVIEETVAIGPIPLVLADTAGLRAAAGPVESIGIERARRAAAAADLLIAVFDSSRPFDDADAEVIAIAANRAGLAILNKRDLPPALTAGQLRARGLAMPIVECRALTGDGLGALRGGLAELVETLAGSPDPRQDGVAISRERHRAALATALAALGAARAGAIAGLPPEIVAVDIAAAADALAAITGAVTTEDVLDLIFREFCIGK